MRTFVTDAEVEAIETACEQTGAGSLVVPEIVAALEHARAAEEMVKLLLSGRAIPKIEAGPSPTREQIGHVTRVLMNAWAKAEPNHAVTTHPTSYVATFADMARAVIEDQHAGELRYDLTPAGRDEVAGTLTAAVMRDLAGAVQP